MIESNKVWRRKNLLYNWYMVGKPASKESAFDDSTKGILQEFGGPSYSEDQEQRILKGNLPRFKHSSREVFTKTWYGLLGS